MMRIKSVIQEIKFYLSSDVDKIKEIIRDIKSSAE